MESQSDEGWQGEHKAVDGLLNSALLLDLEVSHHGKILKIGAVHGERKLARADRVHEVWQELNQLASGASCVIGHNISRHDLPILRETAPDLSLLRLPVIDTLVLSPICFPENPYHHLVKDYKLIRESINDPVADARQAAVLFADEFRTLQGLQKKDSRVFDVLHFLLATPEGTSDQLANGMTLLFRTLNATLPTKQHALQLWKELIPEWGCSSVPIEEASVGSQAQRFALAYAITWLRVAGLTSVLPPWVRLEHPLTVELLKRLREAPCDSPDCSYCRRFHNSTEQLRKFFNFPSFRLSPASRDGGSLQQEIVEAGMRGESLLAILPTGGGKSLCFQLPALVRNFRRGVLTIVISPLQALMKDQVDGLFRRTGITSAAALYGLLTPPERSDVLRGIRLGDVALLYVSPEQLRNRSFREAIAQREIGCWVFDEAHCLSKWGHDFRPDYLYAGRFIRQFSEKQKVQVPPIACFTATAKQDVCDEILAFFKAEVDRELKFHPGGVERHNLRFEVRATAGFSKVEQVHHLLSERLPPDYPGSAIVFRATRKDAEISAEFLRAHGWKAAHFHAGLLAPEKKRVQDEFLAGRTAVICATNAFGMGIDKDDVRLVIHADTPGSLENYLQEAGRAGRDGQKAECILLFAEEDCERQFRMEAFSELSRRDIAQILRSLRKAARGDKQELVITSGEILRDEDLQIDLDLQDRMADTKVRTAISWLERANFLQRNENVTSVFQARPLVQSLAEAQTKMVSLHLSELEQSLWLAILRKLFETHPTDTLTVDGLALLPEFANYAKGNSKACANPEFLSNRILKILGTMAQVGLLKRDMLLTAYVRHKVANASRLHLEQLLATDRKLLDLLALEEPDPEGWMPLSLRLLNHRLCDEKCTSAIDTVRYLLKTLSEDGRALAGTHGSIDLHFLDKESYRVRVRQSWQAITDRVQTRHRLVAAALEAILAKIPASAPPSAESFVEFQFEDLRKAIEQDLLLQSEIKETDAAIQRALMFLHDQHVITLQQGLAVFRSAMTIQFQSDARGEKYKVSDYQPLAHHYKERILQVHVMGEYARLGLQQIQAAVALVLDYFRLPKEEFIRSYFRTRTELLQYATTARSFQRIVTDLRNPTQIRIVTGPVNRNMLILAGPGSGKTLTVVHRCAYLLRVERVRPQTILVCCFNRHAAIELRRRLSDLVGDDARGVTVLTYHALAMRLLGYSFSARAGSGRDIDFDALIRDATKLLRGEQSLPGLEPDEVRERLLAGFQHILVDEYQDIDEPQYQLISAIAGRTLDDQDLKLSILAVGDDDQNIYTFRGANVEFIRRFQQDYDAEAHYLVENYRSTRHIIDTANELIAANLDRMKTARPICIDRRRQMRPPGGDFERQDPVTQGKVQVIPVADAPSQAHAVVAELKRLKQLGLKDWSAMAVLSREHADLAQVRTHAERESIPIKWVAGRAAMPPLHQIREVHRFLAQLSTERASIKRATDLLEMATKIFPSNTNPWRQFLTRVLEAWMTESANSELPNQEALEFLYEACSESRREFTYGEGVTLCTVHSAKGTEFDHVLVVGPWPLGATRVSQEEERRTFYVGLTRARKSLTVVDRADVHRSLPGTLTGPSVIRREFKTQSPTAGECPLNYRVLSLEDINLGFPGLFAANHPIHKALSALEPGDKPTLRALPGNAIGLFEKSGVCISRLSRKAENQWREHLSAVREVRVLAMVRRTADQDQDKTRSDHYKVTEWELPILEVVSVDEGG